MNDARRAPSLRWSVRVDDLATGRTLTSHDGARLLPTASVGKVLLLVEVAARVAAGTLRLADVVSRRDVEPVRDSGLWVDLAVDELPLGDVARLVGAVSDNLATNVLLDLVGLESVQARAATLAPGGSTLHDRVRDPRTPGPGVATTLSEGCADDWVGIVARLDAGRLLGPDADALVVGWLAGGVDHSLVLAPLGLDPLVADAGLTWNKTGREAGVRADVGVVTVGGRRLAYAALAAWEPPDDGAEQEARRRLRATVDQNENVF